MYVYLDERVSTGEEPPEGVQDVVEHAHSGNGLAPSDADYVRHHELSPLRVRRGWMARSTISQSVACVVMKEPPFFVLRATHRGFRE